MPQVGARLLLDVGDRLGWTAGLSAAVAGTKQRERGHDRGQILTHVAAAIADGATTFTDWEVLARPPAVFGAVTSIAHAVADPLHVGRRRGGPGRGGETVCSGIKVMHAALTSDAIWRYVRSTRADRNCSQPLPAALRPGASGPEALAERDVLGVWRTDPTDSGDAVESCSVVGGRSPLRRSNRRSTHNRGGLPRALIVGVYCHTSETSSSLDDTTSASALGVPHAVVTTPFVGADGDSQ